MSDRSLQVYVNKSENGILDFEDDQYVFNYLPASSAVVSLTMPIRKASWNSKTLHPVFQMNMPEGALKEVIKNHFSKIEKMDDLNFLRLIGPYMLGRVKFNKIIEDEEALVLEDILTTSTANLFEELMQRFSIRSGVSGVQPKLLLSAQNKNTMKFEHYIVKSWEKEYPELALNEYFCMRALQYAGLETPDFYLSDDRSMFIMKRFDVQEDSQYLGFEDMCVLTARGTDDKYEGSYEEIVRVIKDVIPPQKRKEALRIFFKALVMNHLLQNGDGHLKNYGVLYENDFEDARLSPIYDVITTTVYIKKDIPALKMSGAKLWWKEKSYKLFAKQSCGLSTREYTEIVDACSQAVDKVSDEVKVYGAEYPEVSEFLTELESCWKRSF